VLDMGDPVQIVDLVHNYAEQLKLPNVEIRYTGLRPGEKLAEKVFSDAEERVPSVHPKIWATRRTEPPADFPLLLERLYIAAHDGDSVLVKELFQRLVPEYVPSERKETLVSAGAPYPDGF
jgi:FlaA1/EpsC-like NDP-sugar epimerase